MKMYIKKKLAPHLHTLIEKPNKEKKTITLTRCRSIGFIMVPWKNSTVVKCRLNKPSNSKSGGFLAFFFVCLFNCMFFAAQENVRVFFLFVVYLN